MFSAFSAPAFLIFLNWRMRLSSVIIPFYLFRPLPCKFIFLPFYPCQICGIPWLPFFHLVHFSPLFFISYFSSHPTGSVSVGVWQMACRRVVVVIEKVVKDFAGTSSPFFAIFATIVTQHLILYTFSLQGLRYHQTSQNLAKTPFQDWLLRRRLTHPRRRWVRKSRRTLYLWDLVIGYAFETLQWKCLNTRCDRRGLLKGLF